METSKEKKREEMITNFDTIKRKINLLMSRMEENDTYAFIIEDRDFANRNKLALSGTLHKTKLRIFLADISRNSPPLLEPKIVVWWLMACNEIWKQVRRRND